MPLSLGISPCPNDTFSFDALLNGRINSDIIFKTVYEDVAQLNQWAEQEKLDVTKISFHAWAKVMDKYQMLTAGAALGFGVGPLLIGKKSFTLKEIKDATIAIPGKNTTANFLMKFCYPNANNKKEMLFSEIENAVLKGKVDLGVIIHENRFTYQEKGLVKIMDLGEYWENETQAAIPLGGIAVRRDLAEERKHYINAKIQESIQYAFDNPSASEDYVKEYAQEMNNEVIQEHINLYVNQYSLSLGKTGLDSIRRFLKELNDFNIIDNIPSDAIFGI